MYTNPTSTAKGATKNIKPIPNSKDSGSLGTESERKFLGAIDNTVPAPIENNNHMPTIQNKRFSLLCG
ncbi:hypothetical protein AUF78_14855 [archaeon 13_1_20CM_2_51_12]|nr:MAG: hypothetical protein AUF78_14855 [archaeon 13_1_20CM_2_51_12]